jgi:hypothetical protein
VNPIISSSLKQLHGGREISTWAISEHTVSNKEALLVMAELIGGDGLSVVTKRPKPTLLAEVRGLMVGRRYQELLRASG